MKPLLLCPVLFALAWPHLTPPAQNSSQMPPIPSPPITMGLWETTITSSFHGQGMDAMPPHVTKTQSCVTPESWTSFFQDQRNRTCQPTNVSFTGHHYSADISCSGGQASGHVDMDFPSATSGHGTTHIEVNTGQAHVVGDNTIETHFVSASCGSVEPGRAVIVR